jgi:predicted restriction endonuclease
MAHIEGIGRGGDKAGIRDTIDNVMLLCVYHHDLLDGRTMMKQREITYLLHELNELRSGER